MRPFLLAFVDSDAFRFIGNGIMLLLALVVGAGALLVLRLARAGLRRRRSLRSAAVPATWWQQVKVAAWLLPAAAVAFVGFCLGAIMLLDAVQDHQSEAAYQTALHRKEERMSLKAAGHYVLADTALPAPDPAWYTNKDGWPLADTTLPAKDRSNQGRAPHVELTLRKNGTFTYHSTIVGDATGQHVTGNWKLAAEYVEVHTARGLRDLHHYTLVFYGSAPQADTFSHLNGSLSVYPDQTTVAITGVFRRRDNPIRFALKQSTGGPFLEAL